MTQRRWVYLVLMLTSAQGLLAATTPVTVSPGQTKAMVPVESRCPTFSWGAVAGADRYELVVYRIGDNGEDSQPVLVQRFRGLVLSWTPSLGRCLVRGERYAWSVRASGKDTPSAWSQARLFQIAAGPSDAEFEQSLTVVQRYLAAQEAPDLKAEPEGEAEGSPEVGAVRKVSEESSTPQALGGADFSVDSSGNVQAASFAGDGLQLSGVNAKTLQGLTPSSFLRNGTDSFEAGTLTFLSGTTLTFMGGTTLHMNGTLRMDGTFVKTGTGVVANFNADFLDGYHGSAYAKAWDVPEIQAGSTTTASLCPTTTTTFFLPAFSYVPAVVISPEGASGFPDSTVGNSYCVIHEIELFGFRHCCYGNDPQELHWIAIRD